MWFSVWTDFATGGGGGGAAAAVAPLAVLSSAFRNVLMRKLRTTNDFFINPPFAGRRTGGRVELYQAREEGSLRKRLGLGVLGRSKRRIKQEYGRIRQE